MDLTFIQRLSCLYVKHIWLCTSNNDSQNDSQNAHYCRRGTYNMAQKRKSDELMMM